MGYHSSPALAFLLTLFNVRLGWWLGNPGPAGTTRITCAIRRASLRPLSTRSFGNTDDETIRTSISPTAATSRTSASTRWSCAAATCIVVSDAGAGSRSSSSTTSATPSARSASTSASPIASTAHASLPRTLDETDRTTRSTAPSATIHYSDVDGRRRRRRSSSTSSRRSTSGTSRRTCYNYAQRTRRFPHESTGDQWFSESQFESYRALGQLTIRDICDLGKIQSNPWRDCSRPRATT